MDAEKYSEIFKIVLGVKNKVFHLFYKEGKTKEELQKFTKEELSKDGIGFPGVGESYRKMVERLVNENSSEVIPNGTDPYNELFEFFGLKVN
ncbi:hypothetical protein KAI92_01335 [Candidatus Parcubacteria bacterium]|nr:hypothetical protein [Candidatus Parcubacteria bacterium]